MRKKVLNLVIIFCAIFFINFDGVKAESSTLTCKYTNEEEKTAATMVVKKDSEKNKVNITMFDGNKKDNEETDISEMSNLKAVSNWECPKVLAIVKKVALFNGFEVYSGTKEKVNSWVEERKNKKPIVEKIVILNNTETISSIGYDGETFDEMYNAFTGATLDCSTEECLKLEPSCKSSDEICLNNQKKLLVYGRKLNEMCKEIYADANISDTADEYKKCEEFDKKYLDYAKGGYFGNNIISSTGTGCTETLGSLGEWLTKIYKILLLAVPVIIMIFGFKDFMKAILNGKEDELKKAGSTFIKRLIFGAVFVVLPIIIKVILSLALGGSFSDICIL